LVANATLVDDPVVKQRPAADIDPDTDIPGLLVTTEVGVLSSDSVAQALDQGAKRALEFVEAGLLVGALIAVQGKTLLVPAGLNATVAPFRCRSDGV
jgi:uncharacterized protein